MSLDSDSLPPPTSRDWFFPTPPKYPKYPRRFTANPRSSFPYCPPPPPPPPPPKSPSFRDVSETAPTPYRDFKYSRTRRRVDVSQRSQRNKASDEANGAVSGPRPEVSGVSAKIEDVSAVKKVSKIIRVSVRDLKNRWHMAVSVAAKRLPFRDTQVHRGSFSQGSWIGDMQQTSDKSVIISEILDPRTKNLLSMSKISDYVLSNELVSMALAMVAEDRQINDVLEELLAEEGNEMHIRQADLYLREGEELSFYEIRLRARQRREIVIGYCFANAERAVINPPAKSERQSWSLKDVFVVIAEKDE